MNTTLLGFSVGILIGGALSGATALLFIATRPYRRVSNRLVIHSTQLLFLALMIGSLLLLDKIPSRLGIEPHMPHTYHWFDPISGFGIAMIVGVVLTIRAEAKWRKSVGLWQRSRRAPSDLSVVAEQPLGSIVTMILCGFFGGFGTAILMPPKVLRVPHALAWYSTVSSLAGAVFAGYVLRKALRQGRSGTAESPPRT
jgi:hypothetical protein